MSKCGKGCMPECEYFTTGGCISPFNCLYKMETSYINTATSQTERGMMIMTDEQMKPELGQKVYVKYGNDIYEETVMAVGKDFFFSSAYGEEYVFDSWKHYFKDYGKTWAFTFKKMKELFPLGVKKIEKGWWEEKE